MAGEILNFPHVKDKITKLWGKKLIIGSCINKKKLAEIAFQSHNNLKKLENIIHPVIWKRIQKELQVLANNGKHIIVLDIALLWESGLYSACDHLIFVDTPSKIRIQRTIDERGWDSEELIKREHYQADLAIKRKAADFIIFNDKSAKR
jgi:dephospho-CoA kinase